MQKTDKIEYIQHTMVPQEDVEIPPHKHFQRDLWDGLKVYTTVPTHKAPSGTMLLYESGATRAIYVRINTGWFSASVA
jgi:hypothetical protein